MDTKVLWQHQIQIEGQLIQCSSGIRDREITYEPLSVIAADDPVTCAAYAEQHDLLAVEGWYRFRSLAKKDEVLARAIKQSKMRQVIKNQHVWVPNPQKLHGSPAI